MNFAEIGQRREIDDGSEMRAMLLKQLAEKQKQQQEQGGFFSNALKSFGGPLGNIIGQTFDGQEGINWGDVAGSMGPLGNLLGQTFDNREGVDMGAVGQSALGTAQTALGIMSGNPLLAARGAQQTTTAKPKDPKQQEFMNLNLTPEQEDDLFNNNPLAAYLGVFNG